jgi:4-amino-4-deoxy-L-arabinose transferase-like glycosyltransferase
VATLCTIFYLADPVIFLYSYSGITETLATFLLLCLFFIITWRNEKKWKWLLVGVVSGLAYLARTQFILLILLMILYVWITTPKARRFLATVLFLVGLLLPLTPWMVRNVRITGDPLFSFTTSRNLVLDAIEGHSDLEMQLHAPVELSTILTQNGKEILEKFFRNVFENFFSSLYWANSFRRMLVIFPLFFFLGLLGKSNASSRHYYNLKWSTLALILGTFLIISLTVYSVRSFTMFRPLILIIGINEIILVLDRSTRSNTIRTIGVVLLILVGVLQLGTEVAAHKYSPPAQSKFDQITHEYLMRKTAEDSIIASDISERISAFTQHRTLRLPADPVELLEINQTYLKIDYVLFGKDLVTDNSTNIDEPGYHETYGDHVTFVTTPAFLDIYTFEDNLPNGSLLYVRKDLGW